MILFLTYHKVCAQDKKDANFYSVTRDQLSSQLESLLAAGFTSHPLIDLPSHQTLSGNSFVLSFDDGTRDHLDIALTVLREFNVYGIFFVPTAKLNRPGYLSDEQLRQISDAGHVVGCHSHDHKRLDTMNETEIQNQIHTSCEKLEQLTGQHIWIFAPPGGYVNTTVRDVARAEGLKMIRTMRWGFNRKPDFENLETVPINRHTSSRNFQAILSGKQPRFLYFGKQAAKALVPARTYERMRGWIFRLGRKN